MKYILIILLFPICLFGQEVKTDTLIQRNGLLINKYIHYNKDKAGKVSYDSLKEYSIFDIATKKKFEKYFGKIDAKRASYKEIKKAIKKYKKKCKNYIKKHNELIGWKDKQKLTFLFTNMTKREKNKYIDDIFNRKDILDIRFDLTTNKVKKKI